MMRRVILVNDWMDSHGVWSVGGAREQTGVVAVHDQFLCGLRQEESLVVGEPPRGVAGSDQPVGWLGCRKWRWWGLDGIQRHQRGPRRRCGSGGTRFLAFHRVGDGCRRQWQANRRCDTRRAVDAAGAARGIGRGRRPFGIGTAVLYSGFTSGGVGTVIAENDRADDPDQQDCQCQADLCVAVHVLVLR